MKAVVLDVSPQELAHRKLTGIDRWDEMWEGVLHMSPAPTDEHQRILDELIMFLGPLLKRTQRAILRSGVSVFDEASPKEDYRIPDISFVAPERRSILARDGVRGGGPDVVLEIRSPGDESYDKFPFFARLGVREVIVIPRDEKKPEVYRLAGDQYMAVVADPEGWVASEILGVRFRLDPGPPERLRVEDRTDPSLRTEI